MTTLELWKAVYFDCPRLYYKKILPVTIKIMLAKNRTLAYLRGIHPTMNPSTRATQAFALYCFCIIVYLTVGGVFQSRWGLPGIALNQILFLVLPALLYVGLLELPFKKIFPFKIPSLKEVLLALFLTALMIVLVELLLSWQEHLWPLPKDIQQFYGKLLSSRGASEIFLKVIILALLPACCEELFFRGFLQSIFRQVLGPLGTIVLVALLFAAAHANLWYFAYYFILGSYLAAYRNWKNNLALCVLIHFLNNLYSMRGMFGI